MGLIFDMLTGRDVNKTLKEEAQKLSHKVQKIEPEAPIVIQKTVYVQQQSVRDQMRIGNAIPEFIKVGIRIFAGLLIFAMIIDFLDL